MDQAEILVRRHVVAIVDTLVKALHSPDGWTRLEAARKLLAFGCGPAAGGIGDADVQRSLDRLRAHLPRDEAAPEPATIDCPARHAAGAAAPAEDAPRAETATHPLSPERVAPQGENTPLAKPELTPCPAATPATRAPEPDPDPGANPMSRDADPMSRAVLPDSHNGSDFDRRLPQPPPVEPPWPFASDAHRRRRWS